MQHIYRINPFSIEDLKHVVEDFINTEIISKACATVCVNQAEVPDVQHGKWGKV